MSEFGLIVVGLVVVLALADVLVVRRSVGEPPCNCGPDDPCGWVDWGHDDCPGQ